MKVKLLTLLLAVMLFGSMVMSFGEDAAKLTLDKSKYAVGDVITVSFEDATGDNNAWIAIYPDGKIYQDAATAEKVWAYANSNSQTSNATAATEGSVTLDTTGLAPGKYKCSYFIDNNYVVGSTIMVDIEAASNPSTGDSFAIFTVAFILVAVVVVLKRKSVEA